MHKLIIALTVAALGIAGSCGEPVLAADYYPNRPVHIVVGYAPGGSVDIVARILADKLSQRMGQRFIVDNRPGGGTIIASEAVARAAPDGYTIMLADIAHGANPALNEKLPYNTEKDFAPVILVGVLPAILAVERSLPVRNLKELIAYAKANNGKLNYSSSGIGSLNFLATELFKKELGLNIVHVPYQSGGQAVGALVGGFVQMLITTAPPLLGQKDKVKILAVSSDKRLPSLPDVPTFAEAGLPGYKMQLWQGVLVPAGTDQTIIKKLNQEFNAVLNMPDVRERVGKLGVQIVGGTSEKLGNYIHAEIARWKAVIPPELRRH